MKQLDLNGADGVQISQIVREYEKYNCKFMPNILLQKIKLYYAKGLKADVIIKALEVTATKGANWEYTEGILKRLLEDGITSLYLWEKSVLFKKNKRKLQKYYPIEEKDLNRLALYSTFKDELKAEEDKLQAYLQNPYPIDIEIPVLDDEFRAKQECRKKEILEELKLKEEQGIKTFSPFF